LLLWQYRPALAAGLIAFVAISAGSCGSQAQTSDATGGKRTEADSEYVKVLLEFRNAAESNATYDAYGYFESDYPPSQKAALDAFCVVVNKVRTGAEGKRLSDPAYFSSQVMAAAKPEAEGAPMASIGRAVARLEAVVEPRSLTPELVKSYAKACY
jgi:hypothetical protein